MKKDQQGQGKEEKQDVEMVLLQGQLGVLLVVCMIQLIPQTEKGQEWCRSVLKTGIRKVWSAYLDPHREKFFVTVIDGSGVIMRWEFDSSMVGRSAKNDIKKILSTVKSIPVSSSVSAAGIIFNGLNPPD